MRQCLTKSAEVEGKDEISNLPTHSAQDLGAKCEDLKEAVKIQTKKMPDTKPARNHYKHPFLPFPNFTAEKNPSSSSEFIPMSMQRMMRMATLI